MDNHAEDKSLATAERVLPTPPAKPDLPRKLRSNNSARVAPSAEASEMKGETWPPSPKAYQPGPYDPKPYQPKGVTFQKTTGFVAGFLVYLTIWISEFLCLLAGHIPRVLGYPSSSAGIFVALALLIIPYLLLIPLKATIRKSNRGLVVGFSIGYFVATVAIILVIIAV